MKRIATVCARGGSEGVPGKNLLRLANRSLINISVTQALKSELFDAVAVSSDDDEILNEGKVAGATHVIKRPDELATAQAGKMPAIQHCVSAVEESIRDAFDVVVELDATSPLRLVSDIEASVQLMQSQGFDTVITGAPARRNPYFNLVERNSAGGIQLCKHSDVIRRQDAPECYDMNASIYVWKRAALFGSSKLSFANTGIYVMPEERSLDVDSPLDFKIMEFITKEKKRFQSEW